MDASFSTAEALAVSGGRLAAVGPDRDILRSYESAEVIDAGGRAVMPGFIDAHCHFYFYGKQLASTGLAGCRSEGEMLERVKSWAGRNPDGWVVGRGWDQNAWLPAVFPNRQALDRVVPDRPAYLIRVDGHAALVNSRALALAGINAGTCVAGGLVGTAGGKPTGILVDNAMDLVARLIPPLSAGQREEALMKAQADCLAAGLTTVDDAGLPAEAVRLLDAMHQDGRLKMRVYAMLEPGKNSLAAFPRPYRTDRLTVRSFKLFADGALGSRGARLLAPYSDAPAERGLLLKEEDCFREWARLCHEFGFQLNIHAIGDAANRLLLDVYSEFCRGGKDLRWRIEHAQVIASEDFARFGACGIVPSVQPTHAVSDMGWAAARLGGRLKNSYAYRRLLEQNGWLPLGTDFPVEEINQFHTFFAAVGRQDAAGRPKGGFQTEDALTREQAARGMTIWAARANFEENEKGSLEPGKWADFVVLDRDIMTCPLRDARNARVLLTAVSGEVLHRNGF